MYFSRNNNKDCTWLIKRTGSFELCPNYKDKNINQGKIPEDWINHKVIFHDFPMTFGLFVSNSMIFPGCWKIPGFPSFPNGLWTLSILSQAMQSRHNCQWGYPEHSHSALVSTGCRLGRSFLWPFDFQSITHDSLKLKLTCPKMTRKVYLCPP